MNKIKYIVLLLFSMFLFLANVEASSEGILNGKKYTETDKKTDYVKIELSNDGILLFQLNKKNSEVTKEFKNLVASNTFDGAGTQVSPSAYFINTLPTVYVDVDMSNYQPPIYGDLVANILDDGITISSFYIQTQNIPTMDAPVFGNLTIGTNSFENMLANSPTVRSIRFVNIDDAPEEDNGESGNNGSTGSGSNNKGDGGVTHDVPSANTNYCSRDKEFLKVFKFIGEILLIIKILIPIAIIGFGVYDFFKAVTSSKDDEIKKSMKSLIMRVIAGLIVFFLPALINTVFRLVDDFNQYSTDYSVCSTCVSNPSKCQV